jgi:glyoxylase-like metal-dependent hydrolase (beta-lactamase superfamily II)/ferredoxin
VADFRKRVAENSPGDFFVDASCIDCDACRQIAPAVFAAAAGHSFVRSQPTTPEERKLATHALLTCPTGSIGSLGDADPKAAMGDFPLPIEGPVYFCGFNSPKSYGGNSYFLMHPDGNWLVDSPKFLPQLVRRFGMLGGIGRIFLTHRDDVADAERYARHFGAQRVIHRRELAAQPGAEIVLEGESPTELASGVLAIPTPGHTAGHCVLLVDDRYLFTGDHLDWERDERRLAASRDYCWHSWSEQIRSTQRLAEFRFEWVLPGHGQRVRLPAAEMRRELLRLVELMPLA